MRAADAERSASPDLVVVRVDQVAALATSYKNAPSATETELRAHDAITSRIHSSAASLPSRFGQLFSDESALTRALEEREETLAEGLATVGDRVELDVTLLWRVSRTSGASTAATGTAYLHASAARESDKRQADQIVARLVEQLPCDRAFARHSSCPREGVAAIVALLVARDEVEMMRRHIESFGERSSEVVVTVHGPLPPYSFAS